MFKKNALTLRAHLRLVVLRKTRIIARLPRGCWYRARCVGGVVLEACTQIPLLC